MNEIQQYPSLDAMWWEALDNLLRQSPGDSRDGAAREIVGFAGRYPSSYDWVWNPRRNASPAYAVGELLWYLRGSNEGQIMEAYAKQYYRFLDDDGTAYGAYGKRIDAFDQLTYVVALLEDQPQTRQAIISMWHPKDLNAALGRRHNDIPCTLSLQFLRRGGKLHLIVTMRSNDIWLGLPYDGWCFSQYLKIVAASIGAKPGWIQHQVGSMHLYERNFKAAAEAQDLYPTVGVMKRAGFPLVDSWDEMRGIIKTTLMFEELLRRGDKSVDMAYLDGPNAPNEWLGILAEKFQGTAPDWLDKRLRRK